MMNWNTVRKHFQSDGGALIDVYFEPMCVEAWLNLFTWLSESSDVKSVNFYDPSKDVNLDYFPSGMVDCIESNGFYCFVLISVQGIDLFLRFYDLSELECDFEPEDIDSKEKLDALVSLLKKIQRVTSVSTYYMCPESGRESRFYIDGEFV